MKEQYEIRFSGAGGQGLITAGIILAKAAVLDGRNVVQTQSYGPEARGGASKSDVIISDNEILYPKGVNIDVLLCLTQESCDQYYSSLLPSGVLVVDEDWVTELPDIDNEILKEPFIMSARQELEAEVVANVISLGFINQYFDIVSKDSLDEAVLGHFADKHSQINKDALALGKSQAENL